MFDDLRGYIKQAEEIGKCAVVEGADWDLEIGLITELQKSIPDSSLLVFDNIKGYEAGYRVVSNPLSTPKLFDLAFGLPLEAKGIEQVNAWRDKVKGGFKPVLPVEVKTGTVKENVHIGDDVNLFEFPTPKWKEHDGGRYIGTGCMVIQRDPEQGWVNLGTYRVQVHDKNIATIHYIDGKHGDIIRRKYWDKGLNAPVAVVCGQEPLLWFVSTFPIPWRVSEYDYAGWLRNKPVEVIRGETLGLPIPATAEIVLEGEIVQPGGETRNEGPFGEWAGYYAGSIRAEPVFKVQAVLHRNAPIILGAPNDVPDYEHGRNIIRAAALWDELDKQTPGVTGVWFSSEARGPLMLIISIKQMHPGYAKRVAMAATGCYEAAWMGRFTIIVDDDIDPSDVGQVLWALGTRCDPETSIDIIRDCWGARSDPILSPERNRSGQIVHSKAIILACKPYHWINSFPRSIRSRPELLRKTREKWGKLLFDKK